MNLTNWLCNAIRAMALVIVFGGVNGLRAQEKPVAPKIEAEKIESFKIAVDEAVLRDLKDRLARTRWPDQIDDTGWEYGVPIGYMKEFVAHWQTKYDWREQEKKLNAMNQFVTRIDGLDIHFVHVRSK